MKKEKLFELMVNIDDKYISEASEPFRKKSGWLRWGAAAAYLALLVTAGAFIIPRLSEEDITSQGTAERNYKNYVMASELAIMWKWEYKTLSEKFTSVSFDGRDYVTRARAISRERLGDILGIGTAEGFDEYTEKTYIEEFEVRSINGLSEERFIAAGMNGEYYVYFCQNTELPATFGEVLDTYDLSYTLELDRFTVCEDGRETGIYSLADDALIWQVLSECRDGRLYENVDLWSTHGNYLSFTCTSEYLGVYKRVLYITEDGYLFTNIFDYAYVYFIGEEAAGSIISYAIANSAEAEYEPYEYSVAGIVTEIGEGYILIDDTSLCVDESEGMTFRVHTDDIRVSRCIECCNIKVGDAVVVRYMDTASLSSDNTLSDAHEISKGTLVDGDVLIAE